MNTLLHPSISTTYTDSILKPSLFIRFINWCSCQEENRFGWLALALTSHGCALTLLTLFIVVLARNSIFLWMTAIAAMGMTLITYLAAMPNKITIPVFYIKHIYWSNSYYCLHIIRTRPFGTYF